MREIKFRAWDGDNMLYQHSFCIHANGSTSYLDGSGEWRDGKDVIELMQYTGMKDKNSIEIYDRDIAQLYHDEAFSPIPPNFKGVVKMIEGCWYIENNKEAHRLWQEIAEWEIIGNIHTNPELL